MLDALVHEVRYAFRQFRRQPVFWAIIFLTLVVGIAASTSIFALVNGVLLRPLPYRAADRLIAVAGLTYKGELVELQRRSQTMEIGGYALSFPVSLVGRGEPARIEGARASGELFEVLSVRASLGRTLTPEDARPGASPTVVFSYELWRRRFESDAAILGREVTIDGQSHTVVGVMPPGFAFPRHAELWLPLTINPADRISLWATNAFAVGRLRPGVAAEQARQEVRALVPGFRQLFPWRMPEQYGQNVEVVTLQEQIVGEVRPTLLMLMAAIVAVLLILCVNVANLLLARGLSRTRELSIRAAVGASRGRLVRQLLVESLTVSTLAGLAGTAGAFALLRFVLSVLPADVPRVDEIGIDRRALLFALSTSGLAGVSFGILPALRATWGGHGGSLHHAGRSTISDLAERRLGRMLTAAEFAAAVVLVLTATLLVKSLWNLQAVDPGFRSEHLVSASVAPIQSRYSRPDLRSQFAADLVERLSTVPGVRVAAAASAVPLGREAYSSVFSIEGRPDPATQSGDWPLSDVRVAITPDYLRALGVPVLKGRDLTQSDGPEAPPVALVSRSLATAYWPDQDPLGARIRFPGPRSPWVTIVGVVADVKWKSLTQNSPALYVPLAQSDANVLSVIVRTDSEPNRLAANLRGIVGALDRETPVADVATSSALIGEAVARPRFAATLLAAFAGVALFLGAIGVYGVMAHAVHRRTQELGLRLALGATTRDLFFSVLGEGALLTLTGLAIGLVAATAATRLVSGLLFGVEPADPTVLAFVSVVLFLVGVFASYLPARRAAGLDPLAALRTD